MTDKLGGIHAQRGFLYQTYSILFYYLIRRLEHPELQAIIESDEDARFLYNLEQEGQAKQITELVQCKKKEKTGSDNKHAGTVPGDEWEPGTFDWSDLKKWVEKNKTGQGVIDILEADNDTYYTVLLFGEVVKKVGGYIPAGIRNSMIRWYSPLFTKAFPVDYRHEKDPVTTALFGNPGVRSRIRVMRTGSPAELELICRSILEQCYSVREGQSLTIVQKLRLEIENRGSSKAENRLLLSSTVEEIIAAGRLENGNWQPVQSWLKKDTKAGHDHSPGDALTWSDLETGRFTRWPSYDKALEALEQDSFLVISGQAGMGKTSLSSFLAYSYLKKNENKRRAYYLQTGFYHTLKEDTEFLKSQIYSETLFIIDNQHLAPGEVESLVQLYLDYRLEGKARISLIVTSARLYAKTQAMDRGENQSVLNQAVSIPLTLIEKDVMNQFMVSLKERLGNNISLHAEELASLSGGNSGLSVVLARNARNVKKITSLAILLRSADFRNAVNNWVLKQTGKGMDFAYLREAVVPVFIIGSYEVPIPEDYTPAVNDLFRAGFLDRNEEPAGPARVYFPQNIRLASLVRDMNSAHQYAAFEDYFRKFPKYIPVLFERLAQNPATRPSLAELCNNYFDDIVNLLSAQDEPIELPNTGRILKAVYQADRGTGIKLLRSIAAPYGYADERFYSKILSLHQVRSVTDLTMFLKTIYPIDRYLLRKLALDQLDINHQNFVLSLFEIESVQLDEIAECLHILKLFSRSFALELYEGFKSSALYSRKEAAAENNQRALSIWLRFCEEIRILRRRDCYAFIEKHKPFDRILSIVLQNSEFSTMPLLLLRVHRLHPRLAANICSKIWEEHQGMLIQLINEQNDLIAICNGLYAIARLNKRVGVQAAWRAKEHMQNLISEEGSYRKAGSAIESLRKIAGAKLAYEIVLSVDQETVLTGIKQEDRHMDLVGKFLYNLTLVSDEHANWFAEKLDYRVYVRRITSQRLRSLSYLIHGFLTATGHEKRSSLYEQIRNDNGLIYLFNQGWNDAISLTEISFSISLLLSIPVPKSAVYQLLNFPNLNAFEKDIMKRMAAETSILHISNCLFALTRFDFEMAKNGLQVYISRIEKENNHSKSGNTNETTRHPVLPADFQPNNLVDIGYLLQIVSAIQPSQAVKLTDLINFGEFIKYSVDETNLGRLTVFLTGLHKTSRKLSRGFIQQICSEDTWERQLLENDDLENVLHYARALGQISRASCNEYMSFVLDRYQHDILDSLEIELNLMLILNWLKLIPRHMTGQYEPQITSFSNVLITAVDYDTQLYHLLEATEALIDTGQMKPARQIAGLALEETKQLRLNRGLHEWITILHKSIRIGRELEIPDFTSDLFSRTESWYFSAMISLESQPVLPAYIYHFFRHNESLSDSPPGQAVLSMQSVILASAKNESSILLKAVSLILAEGQLDEIRKTAENPGSYSAWEYGLASFLFAVVFPEEENPFHLPSVTTQPDWEKYLLKELNEHTGNLEFGLAFKLATSTGLSAPLTEHYKKAAEERAADEFHSSTRWLLQLNPGDPVSGIPQFYIWAYLKNTVLKSTLMKWEGNIEKEVDSTRFKSAFSRDIKPDLTSD